MSGYRTGKASRSIALLVSRSPGNLPFSRTRTCRITRKQRPSSHSCAYTLSMYSTRSIASNCATEALSESCVRKLCDAKPENWHKLQHVWTPTKNFHHDMLLMSHKRLPRRTLQMLSGYACGGKLQDQTQNATNPRDCATSARSMRR